MIRRIRQWFLDGELIAVARDLEKQGDLLETLGSRFSLLEERFQRLQNRLQMRLARAELTNDKDAAILADIRKMGSKRDRDEQLEWDGVSWPQ